MPAVTLIIGSIIGFTVRDLTLKRPQHCTIEHREPGQGFINPLLYCEQARDTVENDKLKPIKSHVEEYINKRMDRSWVDRVTVYFRELNDGPWFAIGELEHFRPASLLKIPVMIAVLHEAEKNPDILKTRIPYRDPALRDLPNPVTRPLEFGKTYTIEELMTQMIVYSDNIATYILDNFLDVEVLNRTYRDLGLSMPYYRLPDPSAVVARPDYTISAYEYASFFRILYNSSYLTREMSDRALRLLASTDFKEGIVAGVPPEIKVAHKWGAHLSGENREIKQFHDCWIIYYPAHPYLLCIMTSGSSLEHLDDAIKEISRVVYEEVDRQKQSVR